MSQATDATPEWEVLLSSMGTWTLEEFPQKALKFLEYLNTDETIANPNIVSGNFLPALCVQLIQLLADRSKAIDANLNSHEGLFFGGLASMLLPKAVLEGNEDVVLAQLASNLMPQSFPGGPVQIRPLCGILEPGNDFQWSPILNDESAAFLQTRAAFLLDNAPEGIDENTEMRWHEIAERHFPLGFNTAGEERWMLVDMRRALIPEQPLLKINDQTIAYLKRAASEKLEILSKYNEEELTEENKAHLVSLQKITNLDVSHFVPKHVFN